MGPSVASSLAWEKTSSDLLRGDLSAHPRIGAGADERVVVSKVESLGFGFEHRCDAGHEEPFLKGRFVILGVSIISGDLDNDFHVIVAAFESRRPLRERDPATDDAREPLLICSCQGVGGRLVVAPVRVD